MLRKALFAALGLVILAAAVRFLDGPALLQALASIPPVTWAGYLGLLAMIRGVLALRLRGLAAGWPQPLALSLRRALYVTLGTGPFTVFLPNLSGEAWRAWCLRRDGMLAWQAVGLVAFDRLVGIGTAALLALPLAGVALRETARAHGDMVAWASMVLALTAAGTVVVLRFRRLADWRRRIRGLVRLLPAAGGLTILLFVLAIAANALVLRALTGQDAVLTAAVLTLLPRLARVLPVNLAGIDAGDGAVVALGGLLGLGLENAVALVAVNLVGRVVFAGIGGFWVLAVEGRGAFHSS